MKIVNWQSLLTDHQYFTWLELQKLGHEVIFVLGKLQNETRRDQGWTNIDLSTINAKVLIEKNWWKTGIEIILQNQNSIHVFNGFWADRRFFPLILFAITHGVKTAIMNESYSEVNAGYLNEEKKITSLFKVQARPLLYKFAISLINIFGKNNASCLFSISSLAKTQFTKAGFISSNIFPFGYFVPQQPVSLRKENKTLPIKIVFVGAMLQRKGLDLAVGAISKINENSKTKEYFVTLDIYGYGNPEEWILPTSTGVVYKGPIPFGQTQSVLAQYDYLILPSRHDGWGVVVNEALLQGVPVILSDRVGAMSLIENNKAGIIFQSENQEDLINAIQILLNNKDMRRLFSNNAAEISKKIQPQSAAKYIQDVLNFHFYRLGERPVEFWNEIK